MCSIQGATALQSTSNDTSHAGFFAFVPLIVRHFVQPLLLSLNEPSTEILIWLDTGQPRVRTSAFSGWLSRDRRWGASSVFGLTCFYWINTGFGYSEVLAVNGCSEGFLRRVQVGMEKLLGPADKRWCMRGRYRHHREFSALKVRD